MSTPGPVKSGFVGVVVVGVEGPALKGRGAPRVSPKVPLKAT